MAKSPRKGTSSTKSVSSKIPFKKGYNNPSVGGKNLKSYNHHNYRNQRRFSIVDSSSSYESDVNNKKHDPDSESESSLTAVSDNDEAAASKKGSSFFDRDDAHFYNPSNRKGNSKRSKKAAKKTNNSYAEKRTPKKTINWSQYQEEEYDDDEETYPSHDDVQVGLGGLYSMMNSTRSQDSESDEDESEEEEGLDYSSSDDSDVDFVKLQAERKAKSMKAVKAMKGLAKQKKQSQEQYDSDSNSDSDSSSKSESESSDFNEPDIKPKKNLNNKRRSSSVSKPKFGRRKSEVILPEDINFTFEFDDLNKFDGSAIVDEEDEFEGSNKQETSDIDQEEDIGEEIKLSYSDTPKNPSKSESVADISNNNLNFDFDFDSQLIQVPKFRDDEINSDDDYEIDDNELLATLQADNDMDEFVTTNNSNINHSHTRNSSIGSFGDEEENDPFLKEEEKFLVNEFENNGFDDDEHIDIEEYDLSDSSNRNTLINSFNVMHGGDSKQVIQYASSIESKSDNEFDDVEDEDEDDYIDFIDFEVSLFENEDDEDDIENNDLEKEKDLDTFNNKKRHYHKKKKDKDKKRNRSLNVGNSEEEDDSYLWNYFFSSDNGSNVSDDEGDYEFDDNEEQIIMEELFKKLDKDNKGRKANRGLTTTNRIKRKSVINNTHLNDGINSEHEYDSGESTDIDLSLPKSANKTKFGSKVAKEVLSSKTADYRPPVLGTWVAIDSKPFGIIDGLSTRTLNVNSKGLEPRTKSRKSVVNQHSAATDDSALGLDELLNISELDDDDENDVKIWRDFNSQKKQVPLGAFRNKSILQNAIIHPGDVTTSYNHTSKSNNEFNQRRYSLTNHQGASQARRNSIKNGSIKKPNAIRRNSSFSYPNSNSNSNTNSVVPSSFPSRSKRRQASIVEAVSEGFRPTKSGLFSEHALADVEEVLGEDHDLMALIKGL